MARILFSTLGTLGDLHPFLAIARALVERRHAATIASHPGYRARVEAAGLEFTPVRPDIAPPEELPGMMARAMDEKHGSEYVVRELVLPHLRASYDDLAPACRRADAIVTHTLSFAGALAAERFGLPRIGTVLQPFSMLSAHDPPLAPALPAAAWLRTLGPGVWRRLWTMARASSRGWFRDVDVLRAELGLPATPAHPLFDACSPLLNLALFPSVLAAPQPDWPPRTVVTGSCLYDRDEDGSGLPVPVREFLEAGDPPIVISLGSSGVWTGAAFYPAAAEAVASLGRRAVLLTGGRGENVPAVAHPGVLVADYAAHSELFPRAAVNVHHGGIGTTGQALRSGRPMVIVPYSHDQPDNAARCERLGVARVVPRRALSAGRLAGALRAVLEDATMAERAARAGERTRAERGAEAAAEAIESVIAGATPRPGPEATEGPS